ncbi:hypothetical protein AGR9A_Lc40478 [Agrobacterium salinitolerans str. Hayward 0363]|nr:hypothetical protein AGR9A_Lc40478 [Agrobacterium salinitolerans str. Hayward 0363]
MKESLVDLSRRNLGFYGLRRICAVGRDRNAARLHGFRNIADEIDVEEAVLQGSGLDLDMVGKLEATLESARGDTAIKKLPFRGFLIRGFLGFHSQRIGAGFDAEFVLIETGDGHGDAIGVLAGPLDIVGRIGLGLFGLAESVKHREKTVEADGGTIEGGKINVTHGVLLKKRLFAVKPGVPFWRRPDMWRGPVLATA